MSFRIEHRLGVPAPAHAVWDVLKEIEQWPQWCGLYPAVSGVLRIGGTISVVEQFPGADPATLRPTILDWVPDSQILWKASSSRGFIKRTRYFEIEALTDTGCVVSNGEIYTGFATRYVSRQRRRAIQAAFAAFNEGLKARVLAAA